MCPLVVCLPEDASPEAESGVQQQLPSQPPQGEWHLLCCDCARTLPVSCVLLLPIEEPMPLKHEICQVAHVSKYCRRGCQKRRCVMGFLGQVLWLFLKGTSEYSVVQLCPSSSLQLLL